MKGLDWIHWTVEDVGEKDLVPPLYTEHDRPHSYSRVPSKAVRVATDDTLQDGSTDLSKAFRHHHLRSLSNLAKYSGPEHLTNFSANDILRLHLEKGPRWRREENPS